MLSRVMVAASLALGLGGLGLGGAALLMPDERVEAVRVESRAAHMAAADAAAVQALLAKGGVVLRLASESCADTQAPAPAPSQARVPAAPASHDI